MLLDVIDGARRDAPLTILIGLLVLALLVGATTASAWFEADRRES